MAILGTWVSSRIEDGVAENAAVTTAFYLESLITPILQPLALEPQLSEGVISALDRMRVETTVGRQIVNIKIWAPPQRRPSLDRVILYSNDRQLIGTTRQQSQAFRKAASGMVVKEAHIATLGAKGLGASRIEFYSPIYESGTKRVIAIAEVEQKSEALRTSIHDTRLHTGFIVGVSTFGMLAVLFGIVRRGSRTIATQKVFLEQRVTELSDALAANEELRRHLIEARRRTGETNERVLRRVGAELHDGPAQLIGLALLRLDSVQPDDTSLSLPVKQASFEIIRTAMTDSLNEIRSLSSGIAPPHLRSVSLTTALHLATRNHEKRTGTEVEREIDEFPEALPDMLKLCLYRFTQEGLNNAYRHANGVNQKVVAKCDEDRILVEVSDRGPGAAQDAVIRSDGLGLAGLRDRVESLGGTFEFNSTVGSGTRLVAQFVLQKGELPDV